MTSMNKSATALAPAPLHRDAPPLLISSSSGTEGLGKRGGKGHAEPRRLRDCERRQRVSSIHAATRPKLASFVRRFGGLVGNSGAGVGNSYLQLTLLSRRCPRPPRPMTSANWWAAPPASQRVCCRWRRISSFCDVPRAYDLPNGQSGSELGEVRGPGWQISLDACASSLAIGSGAES